MHVPRCFRESHLLSSVIVCLLIPGLRHARAQTLQFLRRPDIHGDRVIFTSEGDLWLGSISAGTAQRITSAPGVETDAHFSPDGDRIAFSAQYDGGLDVYVMPVTGGAPQRLTYDPAGAVVEGWTPDGRDVLFRAYRQEPEPNTYLFSVPASGGTPTMLPIPRVAFASMNNDGRRIAYVPVSADWQHWFHYQGGEADHIWLTDIRTRTFRRLTHYRGIDTTPVWIGNTIYFISERDGIGNLFNLDPATRKAAALTHFTDYAVRYPATDGRRVIFEHGNGLALYDPATHTARDLKLRLHSDRIHTRARRVSMLPYLNSVALGPTGKRLLIEARGQILSVPAEHGDVRSLASQPGSRSQNPAWSRDGKQIAFVSDRSGEDEVWIAPAAGAGAPRQLTRDHKGPLDGLTWSPDGKYIATSDRDMRLLLVDVATGQTTLVDQGDRGGTYEASIGDYRFSPDGKWLAYAKPESNWQSVVYLYDIAHRTTYPITSREMSSWAPAFDTTGKYLVLLSNRNFGALRYTPAGWYFDKQTMVSLFTLAAATPSPFLPRDDEEGQPASTTVATGKHAPAEEQKAAALPETQVDVAGIADRVVDVPLPAGRYQEVDMVAGRVLAMDSTDNGNDLLAYDVTKREQTTLISRLSDYAVSADGKKLLIRNGNDISVVDATTGPIAATVKKVALGSIMLDVQPEAEWRQIFNESWRVARDFFYDPKMHGIDWNAVRRKYAAELPAVADRSELNLVLGDMIAELNVGHAYVFGGDSGAGGVPNQQMGYLAADLSPDPGGKAYKFTKLYAGDGFDLGARSPLLAPGINIKPGDYLLAVSGHPVSTDQDVQALLIGTAGHTITLTVNSKPVLDGARDVRIVPLSGDGGAHYYDWVARKRAYVIAHGGPNFAYIHIPDMVNGGLREFTKHYYADNQNADAFVYDVRNNGGGFISALLLLQMASRPYTWFKPRYGASWTREGWAFPGYSDVVCNEYSGSNAEEFCDAFQRLKLGPVIGARTWGGEVGSGGGYALIDGGRIFIPNYGEWAPDGKWVVEGHGAQPDIVVEPDPARVLAGDDPQLDSAIAYLKSELRQRPIARPQPPPFPGSMTRTAGRATHTSD